MRVVSIVVALTLVVLAGGCAGEGADEAGTAGPSAVSSSPGVSEPTASATGAPTGTPKRTAGNEAPPGAEPAALTITGTPREGVEPGCVVLISGGTTYQLLGGDQTLLKSGKQVAVTGTVRADLMTTCQQGTPFEVTSVKLA